MTQAWSAWLAAQGLSPDAASFGDLVQEAKAADAEHVIAPLLDHGLIRASGADAAEFLHNLLTNDIKGIGPTDLRLAGLCTAKGRLLALFHIWRDGDDFLLMLPKDILPPILKKLTMYVLRARVSLRDASDEITLLGYAAAPDAAPLSALGVDAAGIPARKSIALKGGRAMRLDARRWMLALAPDDAAARWQSLAADGARPVGLATWQRLEILAGQARVLAATQEAFVPQMLNLELPSIAAVSFTKGCYPGQEIVARTQYLGKVKRRTYRARVAVAVPPGSHVFAPATGDQHCGTIVSIAAAPDGAYECLVCVQSGARDAGEVRVGTPDGALLEFLPLPYSVEDPAGGG
jgi:folate-binding protein YgfZ